MIELSEYGIFHVFNRSINEELLFYGQQNYHYFIEKIRTYFLPHSSILAYCLMPTHFHFMIYVKPEAHLKIFRKDIGIMLRSYTSAINHQENRHGSLFQAHTKSKRLDKIESDASAVEYLQDCLYYIHNNPVEAGLVDTPEQWEFSSYRAFLNGDREGICDIDLCGELVKLTFDEICSYNPVSRDNSAQFGW